MMPASLCESALRSCGRVQPREPYETKEYHRQERARAGQPEPYRQDHDPCDLDEFHDVRPID